LTPAFLYPVEISQYISFKEDYSVEKKRRGIIYQLLAAALILVLTIVTVCLPRKGRAPSDAEIPDTVSVLLSGLGQGTLALVDSEHPLSPADRAAFGMQSIPAAWYGTKHFDAHDGVTASPLALIQLERMLEEYAKGNATYSVPVLTEGYLAGEEGAADPRGTGTVLHLCLRVPNGDAMSEVPLSSPPALSFAAWLTSHAASYGFTFTDTGTLRFIGTPHAAYLFSRSVTLESYLEMLTSKTQTSPLLIEAGGKSYAIFYIEADEDGNASLTVERGAVFTASGTNMGGFIVTVERASA
jgi:hypothetical protein